MNEKICKKIAEQKEKVIPILFTEKQVEIITKHLKHETLSKTEQTYLYAVIKKKIDALQSLEEGLFYTRGENMIPKRVEQAKQILKHLNKEKAFISGSFLFSKKYNDIDIFVVGKRRKQHTKGKRTYIGIREKDLKQPLFYSASQYSISNFKIPEVKPIIKRPALNDIIFAYQTAIKEILDNEDQKIFRELLLDYYLFVKNRLLESYSLSQKMYEIMNKEKEKKIEEINNITKELILYLYSKKYLYLVCTQFGKNIKETIPLYPKANENLIIYDKFIEEIKYECRRFKAEA